MKKTAILKKLDHHINMIYENLDNISTLLEIDLEDEVLCEMSEDFKKHIEEAISENDTSSYNDIVEYINENY
jgi:hypothetical protein